MDILGHDQRRGHGNAQRQHEPRQQDELRRSNRELEDQAASLKVSEELLQAQQEELQQTNAQLEEKARLAIANCPELAITEV